VLEKLPVHVKVKHAKFNMTPNIPAMAIDRLENTKFVHMQMETKQWERRPMQKIRALGMGIGFIMLLFQSCKKDFEGSTETILVGGGNNGIPTYLFNWSDPNVDFMPTPPGVNPIKVPWANGSVIAFDPQLKFDYKQSDGWVMVYSGFTPVAQNYQYNNPFFILYNKFRGLMRVYVYVTTNGFIASCRVQSGLTLIPNAVPTPLLNYIGQEIVDVSATNQVKVTQLDPYNMTTGSWYAPQFEMAYDVNNVNTTIQQLRLNLSLGWLDVATVNLGGTKTGSLEGTITTADPDGFNVRGRSIKGAFYGVSEAIFRNNVGPDPSKPEKDNRMKLPEGVFKAAFAAATKGLSCDVESMFSGILGGTKAPDPQQVNLTLNADIKITGDNTKSGSLFSSGSGLVLGIPGQSNSQTANGYLPAYDKTLGVVYLSARPKVKVLSVKESAPANYDGPSNQYFVNHFNVVPSSFNISINPEVTNSANVQILSQEILLPEGTIISNSHFYAYRARVESIGSAGTYYNNSIVDGTKIRPGLGKAVVRIVVGVTPNGQTQQIKIVKTFLADIVL
jgi:hypothetical protein